MSLDQARLLVQQLLDRRHGGTSTTRALRGGAALLARLDRLLIEEPGDRWVVVIGGPRMGKRMLLAQWLARRKVVGDMVPHHFIRPGLGELGYR